MPELTTTISKYYAVHGRSHLPWRKTRDVYKILVSEVMLQQTQVDRVLPKYAEFLKAFPTVHSLAQASLRDVLTHWSGLGYNRRAKFLHEAAKVVVANHDGKFPKEVNELQKLPGVGPYTARAIAAFAHNEPVVFIETNIRTIFIYSSFLQNTRIKKETRITDAEIMPLVARALRESKMQPRNFYAALMDYGSFLKKSGVRVNNKSKHYTKQSKFEGSARQLRGAILRELLKSPKTIDELQKLTARTLDEIKNELSKLQKEKLIEKKGSGFVIKK